MNNSIDASPLEFTFSTRHSISTLRVDSEELVPILASKPSGHEIESIFTEEASNLNKRNVRTFPTLSTPKFNDDGTETSWALGRTVPAKLIFLTIVPSFNVATRLLLNGPGLGATSI